MKKARVQLDDGSTITVEYKKSENEADVLHDFVTKGVMQRVDDSLVLYPPHRIMAVRIPFDG